MRPDEAVLIATEGALSRAESWLGWSGNAVLGLGSVWTPHKAMRRMADHLIDHLTQIECLANGEATVPDRWLGRAVTLDSDWAHFTEHDLDEATARLRRLAQILALRLRALEAIWDQPAPESWTIRAIAEHVVEATGEYVTRVPAAAVR